MDVDCCWLRKWGKEKVRWYSGKGKLILHFTNFTKQLYRPLGKRSCSCEYNVEITMNISKNYHDNNKSVCCRFWSNVSTCINDKTPVSQRLFLLFKRKEKFDFKSSSGQPGYVDLSKCFINVVFPVEYWPKSITIGLASKSLFVYKKGSDGDYYWCQYQYSMTKVSS